MAEVKTYRLRATVPPRDAGDGKTKGRQHYELTVPAEIAHWLVDQGISMFMCELTRDGILYRPVEQT